MLFLIGFTLLSPIIVSIIVISVLKLFGWWNDGEWLDWKRHSQKRRQTDTIRCGYSPIDNQHDCDCNHGYCRNNNNHTVISGVVDASLFYDGDSCQRQILKNIYIYFHWQLLFMVFPFSSNLCLGFNRFPLFFCNLNLQTPLFLLSWYIDGLWHYRFRLRETDFRE